MDKNQIWNDLSKTLEETITVEQMALSSEELQEVLKDHPLFSRLSEQVFITVHITLQGKHTELIKEIIVKNRSKQERE